MNRLPASCLLALGILLGCTERYSGGFETSDLQARVVRPSGTPVAAARVWLVKATSDSTPAKALDSTVTDSTGTARFVVIRGVDRKGLGLDAQIGDSLGISIRSLEQSDSATIQMLPGFRLQVGGESMPIDTLRSIGLHIPGSHFASSSAGGTASLLVPQGTWDLAIRRGSSLEFKDSFPITKDSALPFLAPTDTTKRADTTKPIDTLQPGPDISLDSFQINGWALYSDTAMPPPWQWQKLVGTDLASEFLPSLVEEDTGYSSFTSRPKNPGEGADTLVGQGAAGVVSELLPDSGAIAIQFRFLTANPGTDTFLIRRFILFDTLDGRNGVEAKLDYATCNLSPYATLLRNLDGTLDSSAAPSTYPGALASPTIYLVWRSRWVYMFSREGLLGTVPLPRPISRPYLMFSVYDAIQGHTSRIQITKTRIYRPR